MKSSHLTPFLASAFGLLRFFGGTILTILLVFLVIFTGQIWQSQLREIWDGLGLFLASLLILFSAILFWNWISGANE